MKRLLKYCILLFALFQACEEVYTPDVEEVDNAMVVDARIVTGKTGNYITLYQSIGYNNDSKTYPPVSGASVSVVSNTGDELILHETTTGRFPADISLDPAQQYKLVIKHDGKTYESTFQPVPVIPSLDTVYGVAGTKIVAPDGSNNVEDFIETVGVQLYTDILGEKQMANFRFTSRLVLQYTYTVMVPGPSGDMELTTYAWNSFTPGESYNITAPDRYNATMNILKHPLYFLSKSPHLGKESFMVHGPYFNGWILILYQYRLSDDAYNFYDDLNKQLEASGKMFDPLYVQARNNLSCVTSPGELVLGNFEISTISETRYFVNFLSDKSGYLVKPIPWFYDIPQSGSSLYFEPDFWETPHKKYPEE